MIILLAHRGASETKLAVQFSGLKQLTLDVVAVFVVAVFVGNAWKLVDRRLAPKGLGICRSHRPDRS